jgi:hypothetical protein
MMLAHDGLVLDVDEQTPEAVLKAAAGNLAGMH